MIHKQNLHTHTRYCDSRNTPEELVLSAIEQGFTSIGFSGHSFMQFAPERYMAYPNDTNAYKKEIRALKEKYRDQIQSFFDEDSKEYQNYVLEAAEALAGKIPFFEVNTGAIVRGYRTTPYPAPFIIKELKRLGFGAVVTSDCHDRQNLACCRTDAMGLLASCCYKEQFILTDKGFLPVPLETR